MQKIKIFKSFFAPDNRLLKAGEHVVPNEWDLPKSTEVLDDDVPLPPVEGEEDTKKPAAKKPAAK